MATITDATGDATNSIKSTGATDETRLEEEAPKETRLWALSASAVTKRNQTLST